MGACFKDRRGSQEAPDHHVQLLSQLAVPFTTSLNIVPKIPTPLSPTSASDFSSRITFAALFLIMRNPPYLIFIHIPFFYLKFYSFSLYVYVFAPSCHNVSFRRARIFANFGHYCSLCHAQSLVHSIPRFSFWRNKCISRTTSKYANLADIKTKSISSCGKYYFC